MPTFDVLGHVTSLQTGTGPSPKSIQDLEYTWRSNSSLYQRADKQGTAGAGDDVTETFSHDVLSRLTQASTAHGSGTRILTYAYDEFGNLTTKTSSFTGDQNVDGDLNVTGYQYSGAHRLTSATIGGVLNIFSYDAAGNLTLYDAASGDDTVLEYDVRGQVETISVGSTSDHFWYGPDGGRFLKQASWDDNGTPKTEWVLYLAGGAFEQAHPEWDASVLYRQQVQVTRAVTHSVTVDPLQVSTETFTYQHRDHLGSIDKVTDANGNELSGLAFDPFGGRRHTSGAHDLPVADVVAILAGTATSKRGYTDHEHLDRTGFIHMNGRVYDPRIGRFTSPDPFVQSPTFSQSYNRYAYVLNDPVSFTDSSGFMIDSLGWSIFHFSIGLPTIEIRIDLFTRAVLAQIDALIRAYLIANATASDTTPDDSAPTVSETPTDALPDTPSNTSPESSKPAPDPVETDPLPEQPTTPQPPPSGTPVVQSERSVDKVIAQQGDLFNVVAGDPIEVAADKRRAIDPLREQIGGGGGSSGPLKNRSGDFNDAAAAARTQPTGALSTIKFGRVPNQVSHTFRHTDAAGLPRTDVRTAIMRDITQNAASIRNGLNVRTVQVNGTDLTVNVFRLPDGTINVGRITPPR